jgi:hypothetical protein
MIYHYTNSAGLKGILESGNLWFSDIFGLNDPSELRHGLGCAIDILKAQRFDIDAGIEAGDGDDLGQRTPMPTMVAALRWDSMLKPWKTFSAGKMASWSRSIRPFR